MPSADDLVLVGRAGSTAIATLHRPEALNALTPDLLTRLGDVLEELAADPAVAVVVLTGAGRAFSAGVDLKALGGMPLVDGAVGAVLDEPARRAIAAITGMAKVVIAKVNGACFTGALELVLACDLVAVASEAKLGDTHAKWGLRPTWGMSQRLGRAVGPARARLLSYTARTFTGAEAAEWGMAALAVPGPELDAAVDALAEEVAACSPGSLAAYKDLYQQSAELGLSDGVAYEAGTNYPITDSETRVAAFR